MFSTGLKNFLPFSSNLNLLSANSLSFDESKFCRFGKRDKLEACIAPLARTTRVGLSVMVHQETNIF